MASRNRPHARIAAVLVVAIGLATATAPPAKAQDEGLWQRWVEEVTERDKFEIPFAVLFSLPAMIVTTPFWLAEIAYDKLTEEDE